jgi:hypothetical protein
MGAGLFTRLLILTLLTTRKDKYYFGERMMDEFNWAIKAAKKWAARRKKTIEALDHRPEYLPSVTVQIWRLERLPDGYWEVRVLETSVRSDGRLIETWHSYNLGPAQIGE